MGGGFGVFAFGGEDFFEIMAFSFLAKAGLCSTNR